MNVKVTVAYGDGIGHEITQSVLSILQEAGADISIDVVEIGYKAYEKGWKTGISDSAWNTIIRNNVFLKAPITTPRGGGFTSLNVTLRKALGLCVNVRPCISYLDKKVNVVIIRENEEDVYSGVEYRHTNNSYTCLKIASYDSSFRICKYAFDYAKANNRKKVTCLIKDNIMKMTDGIFHLAFKEVAKGYPEIIAESYILDIGTARLATKPEDFDVIVTTNLYGDVISDIAAEITGSVGLAGSTNIGQDYAMFEAVHGSAPDIADQNIANPSGLLNAATMMLSFIGQGEVSQNIYRAWYKTIVDGVHTADIYTKEKSARKVSTDEFTAEVILNLNNKSNKELVYVNNVNSYPNVCKRDVIPDTTVSKSLIGVDVFIEWKSQQIDELVTRLLSVKSEDLELKNVLAKGLIIWPRTEIIKALPVDNVCCRFLVSKTKEVTSHDSINLLLLELFGLEVFSIQKLYLFDGETGFRPI